MKVKTDAAKKAASVFLTGWELQFFRLCSGAGMRPPRAMNSAGERPFTRITGASPSNPPKETVSPSRQPAAGISRTAVVFELTTPIAA